MTTKLSATSVAPFDAHYTKFQAAISLEQQAAVLIEALHLAEQIYNEENPTTTKNQVQIQPDYDNDSVICNLAFDVGQNAPQDGFSGSVA